MATIGKRQVMDIEKTGVEIDTNVLNITFAKAVPKKARIKTQPKERVISLFLVSWSNGKSENKSTKAAGIEIDMKFPKAIPKAETPFSLYLIIFTFME